VKTLVGCLHIRDLLTSADRQRAPRMSIAPPRSFCCRPTAPAAKKKSIWGAKKTSTWNCSACFVECAEDAAKCPACGTAKPGGSAVAAAPAAAPAAAAAAAPAAKPAKKGSIWDKTAKKTSGWNCSACFVECGDDAVKCPACGTAKPGGATASASAASSADAGASKPKISFGTKQPAAGASKISFGTKTNGGAKAAEDGGAASKFAVKSTAFGTKK